MWYNAGEIGSDRRRTGYGSQGRGQPGPAQCCRNEQAIVKTANAPDLSLRGGQRPTWQSREGSHDFADGFPVIQPCTARLPRRFAPRNDKPLVFTILTITCSFRQHCAGSGMPLPYNAQLAAPRNNPLSIIHFPLHTLFHNRKNYKSYGGKTYVLCPQGSGGSLVGRRE